MNVIDALYARRSCRKYTEEPVSNEDLVLLMEAAMAAPSAKNLQPWRFAVVSEKKTLEKIREAAPYGRYPCPVIILVIGDKSKSPLFWPTDCAAATENILLAATERKLGTVWCAVYPDPERMQGIKEALGYLSEDEEVFSQICLGHPVDEPEPRSQFHPEYIRFIE